jgi:hypothetical protein
MAKKATKPRTRARQAPAPTEHRRIPLADIDVDDLDVQARLVTDINGAVRDYAEAMKAGAQFPPVVVFEGPDGIVLADGFSRHAAAEEVGATDIEAEVHQGAKRDAILYACGANQTHGQRRTNADKRRAVSRLLLDPEWGKWSDVDIAERCGVSHSFVSALRKELSPSTVESDTRTYTTKHGKTAKMRTGKIGKRKEQPASKPRKPRRPQTKEELIRRAREGIQAGEKAYAEAKAIQDELTRLETEAAEHTVRADEHGNAQPQNSPPTQPTFQEPGTLDAATFEAASLLRLLNADKHLAKILINLGGTAAAVGQALLVMMGQPEPSEEATRH